MFGGKGNNNFSFGTNIIQRLNLYMPTIWELIIPTEKPEMQVVVGHIVGLCITKESEINLFEFKSKSGRVEILKNYGKII